MLLLGDEAQLEACFGPFGDRLILTQDRCTVCAERTTGSKIVLTHLIEPYATWAMWNLILLHLEIVFFYKKQIHSFQQHEAARRII
jgi:hypothetical protein